MLDFLGRLGDAGAARDFVELVVEDGYENGINGGLVTCLGLLEALDRRRLAGMLMKTNAGIFPADCIDLLSRLSTTFRDSAILEDIAGDLIGALPRARHDEEVSHWAMAIDSRPTVLSGEHLAALFSALRTVGSVRLVSEALVLVAEHPEVYPPDVMIVPALKVLQKHLRRGATADASYGGLWRIAAGFLIDRSAAPPPEPTDWIIPVKDGCHCADCKELLRFAADPQARTCRLPLRKDRRLHLHRRIDGDDMDMTHQTDRHGSPYTLVCTKTRRSHERRLVQYKEDIQSMRFLTRHPPSGSDAQAAQLVTAINRKKSSKNQRK
jgi:hypothetical protein